MIEYKPEKCECCGQTKTYILGIDEGTIDIVRRIATFIGEKGINCVHPRKEMEGYGLSSNQVGNLSRPRFHGLIAKIKGDVGNYCLTKKGQAFLSGESIPKYAIVSKAEKRQVGYYEAENEQCTMSDYGQEYWDGVNYDIVEGFVHTEPPKARKSETLKLI